MVLRGIITIPLWLAAPFAASVVGVGVTVSVGAGVILVVVVVTGGGGGGVIVVVVSGGAGRGCGVVKLVVAVEVGGVVGVGDIVGVVCPPRAWTSICNVGTRDMPVNNTIDNTITPSFEENFLNSIIL
jgi:hypothetical protein